MEKGSAVILGSGMILANTAVELIGDSHFIPATMVGADHRR